MHKLTLTMALLMSLVLGTGFAISGNPVAAQSYENNDYQSYDDSSYYSSDSYSKYPTSDKPYQCQRGPFQGFYVTSVEFCKPDSDDKKDFDYKKDKDNNGGISINTYPVDGPIVKTDPNNKDGQKLISKAKCDRNDQLTGGGFEFQPVEKRALESALSTSAVTINKQLDKSIEEWTAAVEQTAGEGETSIQAQAICIHIEDKHNDYNDHNDYQRFQE